MIKWKIRRATWNQKHLNHIDGDTVNLITSFGTNKVRVPDVCYASYFKQMISTGDCKDILLLKDYPRSLDRGSHIVNKFMRKPERLKKLYRSNMFWCEMQKWMCITRWNEVGNESKVKATILVDWVTSNPILSTRHRLSDVLLPGLIKVCTQ